MNETKLTVIRALLAKAESTDSPQEAETLTAKAMELLAKYGIDEALLEAKGEKVAQVITKRIVISGAYANRRSILWFNVAKILRVKSVQVSNSKAGYVMMAYGFEADFDRLEILWNSLDLQLANAMANAYVPYYENKRSYMTTFIAAYTSRVISRLKEREEAAEAQEVRYSGSGTSLVLVNRNQQVANVFHQNHSNVRKGTSAPVRANSGYQDGLSAGNRASFGGSSLGSSRSALGR